MKFAHKLKALRKKHGMSQQKLAEEMNVVRTTVTNWETGYREPEIDTLIKIAELFGVSLEELVGKSDNKHATAAIVEYNNKKLNERFGDSKVSLLHRELDILTEEELNEIEFAFELIKRRRSK